MVELTPVVVFAYTRPVLLHGLLSRLELIASDRKICLYVDKCPSARGPKAALNYTTESVAKHFVARGILDLKVVTRSEHFGLRRSVIQALDDIFTENERVIVLEDDCLPSKQFLVFCDETLRRYELTDYVSTIGGTSYRFFAPDPSRVTFVRQFSSWGWATWRNRWKEFASSDFNPVVASDHVTSLLSLGQHTKVPRRIRKLINDSPELDSWAVPFAAWQLSQDMCTVLPPTNLIENVGFGADSTHTKFESWADNLAISDLQDYELPEPCEKFVRRDTIVESMSRGLRWIVFPLLHPLESTRRSLRFLASRREIRSQ